MDASCKLQDNIHKFKLNIYVSRILGTHQILVTIFSYIIFGGTAISMEPDLAEIIYILFIPQTIFLILAYLRFKKIEKNS